MVKKTKLNIKLQKKKARDLSIKEGIFAATRTSFGDYYISPFAIAINASNSMVALLTSILGLLGPLSQTFGSRLIEKFSRKKILRRAILFESLTWIPMILIAILFYKGIIVNLLPLLLLITFAIYTTLLNIAHPAWFSWMGDLVEEKHRGRWFSKRNLIIGFVSIILAIIASFFLDYFKKIDLTMIGFIILFSLALIARLVSRQIYKRQYEPKIKLKKGYYFSFWDFIMNLPKNNFGKFTIFRALLSFSSAICAPLIAIYLLRIIGFSYTNYIIITLGGTFASLFLLEFWGKFADRYGNYKTVIFASIFIPITPILWILYPNMLYLLLVPSIISGTGWAGIYLSTGNFIYDNISQEKRGLVVSYFNMVWGIGVFLGAGVGAILIKFLNTSFMTPIVAIFLISAIARAITAIWWLPKIKEVKKTRKFNSKKAFKNLLFKEAGPTISHELHDITLIKKYLETK